MSSAPFDHVRGPDARKVDAPPPVITLVAVPTIEPEQTVRLRRHRRPGDAPPAARGEPPARVQPAARRPARHIVEEARSLAGARYGALGVLDPDRREVVEFYVAGLFPDDEARLLAGPLPTGRGVLGVLIDDPRPIRIRAIGDHPASVGSRPGTRPMTSFLGAPIKVRDQVYGNLYLTDKIGADEFTADDEAVIEALAVAAGHRRGERPPPPAGRRDGRLRGAGPHGPRPARRGDPAPVRHRAVAPGPDRGPGRPGGGRQHRRRGRRHRRDHPPGPGHHLRARRREGRGRGIRSGVLALVEELRPVLGFRVPVDFAGPVDAAVSDEVAEQLLATLREALSNVARHARATAAAVSAGRRRAGTAGSRSATTGGAWPAGRPPAGGHGLPNMASRAECLGGIFEVLQPEAGGTTLVWEVPAFRDPAGRWDQVPTGRTPRGPVGRCGGAVGAGSRTRGAHRDGGHDRVDAADQWWP